MKQDAIAVVFRLIQTSLVQEYFQLVPFSTGIQKVINGVILWCQRLGMGIDKAKIAFLFDFSGNHLRVKISDKNFE